MFKIDITNTFKSLHRDVFLAADRERKSTGTVQAYVAGLLGAKQYFLW